MLLLSPVVSDVHSTRSWNINMECTSHLMRLFAYSFRHTILVLFGSSNIFRGHAFNALQVNQEVFITKFSLYPTFQSFRVNLVKNIFENLQKFWPLTWTIFQEVPKWEDGPKKMGRIEVLEANS